MGRVKRLNLRERISMSSDIWRHVQEIELLRLHFIKGPKHSMIVPIFSWLRNSWIILSLSVYMEIRSVMVHFPHCILFRKDRFVSIFNSILASDCPSQRWLIELLLMHYYGRCWLFWNSTLNWIHIMPSSVLIWKTGGCLWVSCREQSHHIIIFLSFNICKELAFQKLSSSRPFLRRHNARLNETYYLRICNSVKH